MNLRTKLFLLGWLWLVLAFVLARFTIPWLFGPWLVQYNGCGVITTVADLCLVVVSFFLIDNRKPGANRALAWIGWRWHDLRRRKRD